MLNFKQRHFKNDVILMLVRWYAAYALSYRDIEELSAERGLKVDHSTINRWVIQSDCMTIFEQFNALVV